jgi:hypothetical protein
MWFWLLGHGFEFAHAPVLVHLRCPETGKQYYHLNLGYKQSHILPTIAAWVYVAHARKHTHEITHTQAHTVHTYNAGNGLP